MKNTLQVVRPLLYFALLSATVADAAVVLNPALTSGSNAIDPAGEQTVDQTASGATAQATLEALSGFSAIQDFTGWAIYPNTNYVVFSDVNRPDVKANYSSLTGSSPGGGQSSTYLRSSPGTSMGIDSGSTSSGSLTLDFGSATWDGTTVTAFDSAAMAPKAVGFTVSGLNNVSANVTVTFYGTDDTTVLSTQVLNKAAGDPDTADTTTYGGDGYVGFQATGTGAAGGIGKVRIATNQINYGGAGVGVDDLGYDAVTTGRSFYMTPAGAGSLDGTSWANAYPKTQIGIINTLMVAGDTLYLGSGNYGTTGLTLTTSGTAAAKKRIIGVNTGSGKPLFDTADWRREYPSQGDWSIVTLQTSASYWDIENLSLRRSQYAVESKAVVSPNTDYVGITLRDIDVELARHGFYLRSCDNLLIERCSAKRYTKHGFRFDQSCNTVAVKFCTADLSIGDATWYDYSESIPFGFVVQDGGASNTNLTFEDCVANNHLRNRQQDADNAPTGDFPGPGDVDLDGDGVLDAPTYWNGDGFVSEGNTVGLIFRRCIALNNEDGGFDLKQATGSTTILQDCVAVGNSRNFRFWYRPVSLNNCVGTFARKRQSNSSNGKSAIWAQDAIVTADFFTGHGNNDSGVREDGAGSVTLTNSILSSTVSGSTFTTGSVTLGTGTVTYQPGSANPDPNYVNPTPTWDGVGNAMDSQYYGLTKGWHD